MGLRKKIKKCWKLKELNQNLSRIGQQIKGMTVWGPIGPPKSALKQAWVKWGESAALSSTSINYLPRGQCPPNIFMPDTLLTSILLLAILHWTLYHLKFMEKDQIPKSWMHQVKWNTHLQAPNWPFFVQHTVRHFKWVTLWNFRNFELDGENKLS